jgi:beta-phosphoglucomutase-like phosphatase (HAD superfamily)
MKLNEKLILVDCDGVLLDWQYGFFRWMKQHGHEVINHRVYDIGETFGLEKSYAKSLVRTFNESAAMGWLPQFRDSIKYVRKLHEDHGFLFHCITSLSLDEYAGKLRKKNLEALFGKTVFEKIECLDCGADKDDALLPYKDSGCVWVEDKPENAVAGLNVGLNSILIQHAHNENFSDPRIQKVKNWREIYEMIV